MVNSANGLGTGWSSGTVPISSGYLGWHRRSAPGSPTGKPKGPALVLSHGLTDNGLCWSRLVATLPPALDLVLLDARGHGASARVDPASQADPARDIAEALDGLEIGQIVLMGHSVGALASAAFAGRWPERSRALILEDPPLLTLPATDQATERREEFRRYVTGLQALDDSALSDLGRVQMPPWHDDDLPAWAQAKRQVDPAAWPAMTVSWQDILARIEAPTLLLCGDPGLGSLVSAESAAEAVRIMPRLTLRRIAAAGHNLRRENLREFAAAVHAFLKEQLPGETG